MSCEQVQTQLAYYSVQHLSRWRARRLEAHLHRCPQCQREWHLFQRALDTVRTLPERDPPNRAIWTEVRARLHQREVRRQTRPWSRVRRTSRLVLVGALMGLLLMGIVVLREYFNTSSAPLMVVEPRPPAPIYVRQPTEMAMEEPFADRIAIGVLTSATRR